MPKKIFVFLSLILLSGCLSAEEKQEGQFSGDLFGRFKPGERVLILAPHPDDEAIACAGIIQQALKSGAKVKIIYLTNGDHNELAFIIYEKRLILRQGEFIHMGNIRRKEATQAMEFLGLSKNDLVFLGYPDYGTFEIFSKYWRTKIPFRDRLTRIASVPYADNPSFKAPYCGESILRDLENQILDYKPDEIFVSHPADVNVDHKSFYLFLQVALSELDGLIKPPKIYPYLVHVVGWPKPRHYHPEMEMLPPEKFADSKIDWQRFNLNFEKLDKKYRSILFYKSQTSSAAFYLLSFARENELFGDFPILELSREPDLKEKMLSYFGAQEMLKEKEYSDPVGILEENGSVSYAITDNYFVVRLEKPVRLSRRFGALIYIFGYSKNTPFPKMPKIRIITSANRSKVFNARQRLTSHGVILTKGPNYLVLKIPIGLLGEPDYVLTSLKAYHGSIPIDSAGFRKIIMK